MIQANTVLEAWDKTLETKDFTHLEKYLSDDFKFEDTTGELDNLENTKSWCIAGGLRISNLENNIRAIFVFINNKEKYVGNINDKSRYCLRSMG